MAGTEEFMSGPDMVMKWTYTLGTVPGTIVLDNDYRTCTINTSADDIDATAGHDTNKHKLIGFSDASVDIDLVAQQGGTALLAATKAGQDGTLTIYPEGTATGKPSYTVPAFAKGPKVDYPYNDIAKITLSFEANGDITYP